jgi:predicted ATPase
MTDQEIIEIRKATKPADVTKPWGDTLAFARAIIEAYKKTQK